jgi:hypothetical protein
MVSTTTIIVCLIAFSGQACHDVEAFAGCCPRQRITNSQSGHHLYRNIDSKPVTVTSSSSSRRPALFAEKQRDDETNNASGNFWAQQKMLAESMTAEVGAEVKAIEEYVHKLKEAHSSLQSMHGVNFNLLFLALRADVRPYISKSKSTNIKRSSSRLL